MTAPAISVRNVTKRFASHQALDSVTLEIALKESVVILGSSGCGKTTLLRLIAGLEVPDSGEIWLGDLQVAVPGRSLCVYTHKLDFELDTSVAAFNWLPGGRWLRGVELEGSLDYVASGLPRAGDSVNGIRYLENASPWSLSLVFVIPVAPF